MKLFQKILLAPAALGLLAPIAANANEANYGDVTTYSQDTVDVSLDSFRPLSHKNPLLAGGEGTNQSQSTVSDFDVDTFSSTTTASFTSNFAAGALDDGPGSSKDKLGLIYDWEMALSSSFTGNDSLDVVLNAGNSGILSELDLNATGSVVQIDTISYTTSLGDRTTAFFASGDGVSGSSLYNTACVYGAQVDTFTDCGVSAANLDEGLGTAIGASYDFGNGFSAAIGYEGQGMSSNGLATDAGVDAYGANLAYLGDSYGLSISWGSIENHSSANVIDSDHGQTQSRALQGYFAPDLANFPTISAGFETNHDDSAASSADETSHYFLGLQWDEVGNGTLGAAVGSKSPYLENADALTMYEVFYSYNYADGITVTPIIYSKENSSGIEDETGLIVKTQFSF